MVHFMFKYLRHKAARTALNVRAVSRTCFDSDALMPLRRPIDAMHREASFICFRSLTRRFLLLLDLYISPLRVLRWGR